MFPLWWCLLACPRPPVWVGDAGVTVLDVVDGDTFTVELDGERERVRLIGINTPERGECLADEATEALETLLGRGALALVSDRSGRDQHGRLLRYAEVDGQSVNEALVARGLALAVRYPPDTARAEALESAQARAERKGLGVWSPSACGAAAAALRIVGLDPDGAEDEEVRIANPTAAPVSLAGWVLKDTSASHRYAFPSDFTLAPGAEVTVRTGCGTDGPGALHWCVRSGGVWNNGGDTAFLLDPNGTVVHHLSY